MSIEVRPLEWRNVDASPQSDDWWFEASTPFGNYTVTFIEEHTLPWLLEPFRSNLASNYATEDEAMSAGAADYAARILSAIHPAPSREAVIDRAAIIEECAAIVRRLRWEVDQTEEEEIAMISILMRPAI